jgi:hypothetical protein
MENGLRAYDLDEGNADVEIFSHIREPDQADIGHEECSQASLLRRQIPDAANLPQIPLKSSIFPSRILSGLKKSL